MSGLYFVSSLPYGLGGAQTDQIRTCLPPPPSLLKGADAVKTSQMASIAGAQGRISQPETPVTLQFQGNKFTLSPSQLRQLTTGQPLQLQGTLGKVYSPVICLPLSCLQRPLVAVGSVLDPITFMDWH